MKKIIFSFKYALQGIVAAFKTQPNFKIEVFSAIFVLLLSIGFTISKVEWFVVLLNIGLILSLELLNTAIEKTCDLISTKKNLQIKFIKDVAAAAVLIVSFASFVCGTIIFLPKFLNLLK